MIKLLLQTIVAVCLSFSASASTNIKDLKKSVFKIAVFEKLGPSVATAFVIKQDGVKYIVTNNHVCDSFFKSVSAVLIPTATIPVVPKRSQQAAKFDGVTAYYMHPGSDICVISTSNQNQYEGLTLSNNEVEPTDDILISGFVGRSTDLMYVTGKVYGSVVIPHPLKLNNCILSPPGPKDIASAITCTVFGSYPTYQNKKLITAVNNIGPGFSGSPVIKDGNVVGIVSRYFLPGSGYNNEDVVFFPVSDIKAAIKASKDKLVPFDSKEYRLWIKIFHFDEDVKEVVSQFQKDIQGLIEGYMGKDE
jgi:S1-C subfamily serine protease